MNLFNDRKLARRLKAGEVSTKERFYYLFMLLLISQLLATSFIVSITYNTSIYNWWDIATDITYLGFAFFGLILIYNTNRQGDNKNLIERFICISVPITIQLTFCFLLIYLMVRFSTFVALYIFSEDIYFFILNILFNSYFYFRLNHSIKIASH